MNNIQITVRITICLFIFNQHLLSMKRIDSNPSFNKCFSLLSPEMQIKVFKHSDSKPTFQSLNKMWREDASIKSPRIFDNDLAGLSKERITRILIHATYRGNYEGVENILKHSSLLGCAEKNQCTKDHMLYYYIDNHHGRKIIDFYDVVSDHKKAKWLELLKKYRIIESSNFVDKIEPHPIMMSCLSGNSYLINTIADDRGENLKNALYIAIDCGYYSCVKTLINNLYHDSCFGDMSVHAKNTKLLLTLKTLQFACLRKNIQIIEEILKTEEFDLNEIQVTMVPSTFLDQVIDDAQKNNEYNNIVLLLQKYGAKTIKEVRERAQEEKETILNVLSCVIS